MQPSNTITSFLADFYRCPEFGASIKVATGLSPEAGFFSLADGTVSFGRVSGIRPSARMSAILPEARAERTATGIALPFDPLEVITNLQLEKYTGGISSDPHGMVRQLYYLLRPLMPVAVRKHLQRFSLRGWERIPFPQWPVDRTVERIYEWLLAVEMKNRGLNEIPFIWFWPEGHSACVCMTHDVETSVGRDFCTHLMDINDAYGIKSSFQVVPEDRYDVPEEFLESIRHKGFEVNVHDLNHDGQLFSGTRDQFVQRVERINAYGKQFRARGFRSAVLYRKQAWMSELDFDYDMSVPSVAHLDPQRGGCCSVMPFFMGDMVEIPVTTIQDYSLFHILGDYSTQIWEQQVAGISDSHGLASFIVHPDYIIESRARRTYEVLLAYLAEKRITDNLWAALPGEINDWWRARSSMRLVKSGGGWTITGDESERARVAYAELHDGKVSYRLEAANESLLTASK